MSTCRICNDKCLAKLKMIKEERAKVINTLETGWCSEALAETAEGKHTLASNPMAVKFSLWGALYPNPEVARIHMFLIHKLMTEGKTIGLVQFNQASTKEEVIAFLRRAIDGS